MPTPLFVADIDTLKSSVRLSGIPSGQDAERIFNDSVIAARNKMYRRLGSDRIVVLQGYTSTETPTTDDEYLRSFANECEVKLVRCELITTLPTIFTDASGDGREEWDDEAPFRKTSSFDREKMKIALKKEIEELFELLEGSDAPGSETTIRATVFEPDQTPTRLGGSIWQ